MIKLRFFDVYIVSWYINNISVNDILGGDRYEQRDTTDRGSLLYIISS